MNEEADGFESVAAEPMPPDPIPAGPAVAPSDEAEDPSQDVSPEPESEAADSAEAARSTFSVIGHGCGVLMLLTLAVLAVLSAGLAAGARVALRQTTPVPSVTGLWVDEATSQILESELATAPMEAFASTDFLPDAVMQQSPLHAMRVSPGSPVSLMVAVAPTPTVVPDVYCDTAAGATAKLQYGLLRPVLYEQLSDDVPAGRVVAQMPRAGQSVMTGQQVALFVSMGRGKGGAVVPSLIGKPLSQAATEVAGVYLVAMVFDPRFGATIGGTVTDQVPAPGSRVPIGSAVPLITSETAR